MVVLTWAFDVNSIVIWYEPLLKSRVQITFGVFTLMFQDVSSWFQIGYASSSLKMDFDTFFNDPGWGFPQF